ncbi:MAG: 6,7-dimethyl-8-ribityllumazine synthase [Deltaproteobacteria bacterium]|nr:6,7-dimethyl-8-ribityllumazine synthase [Deltaproteobacteria bacterium]
MAARELTGSLDGTGMRVGVVVARFNRTVTEALLAGALEALTHHGVATEDIVVVHVPGAFEVPFAARRLAGAGVYDALVCLGAVVRGETPHFEYIAAEVTRGIGRVVEDHRLPIAFGVLTTDSIEQALERAGAGHGNKGYESAVTAIEMARLGRLLG